MSYWLMLLVYTFVSFPCVILLVLGMYAILQSRRAERTFLPVEAVVLSKSISEDRRQTEENGPVVYGPVVEYRYQVGGATHTCSIVFSAGDVKRSKRWAERVCDPYKAGQMVLAYYNPADPAQAFLVRGGRLTWRVLAGVGLLGLVLLGAFAHWADGELVSYVILVGASLFLTVTALLWLGSLSGPPVPENTASQSTASRGNAVRENDRLTTSRLKKEQE